MIDDVAAPWAGIALVCRKCSKKLHGGFGHKGREKLSKELRAALKEAGHRRALRVIEVGCLGLCPKRAVTIAAEGGRVLVVPEGATMDQVLPAVLPPGSATGSSSSRSPQGSAPPFP